MPLTPTSSYTHHVGALRAFRESSCARAGDGRGRVGGSIVDELILPCTRELRSRCVPRGRLLRKWSSRRFCSSAWRFAMACAVRRSVAHNARRRSSAPLAGPYGTYAIHRGLGAPPPPALLPPPQRLPRVAAAASPAAATRGSRCGGGRSVGGGGVPSPRRIEYAPFGAARGGEEPRRAL